VKPLRLADAKPKPGASVIVVGNPAGLEGSISSGVVSATREHPLELVQIDAAISPGSSGGPVLDETGKVIGVVRLFLSNGQNLNFAIPAHLVEAAVARSQGSISMARFAAATAPPAPSPVPSAPTAPAQARRPQRPAFPSTIAGFAIGSSIREARERCGAPLIGETQLASCDSQPVPLRFATGKVWLTFSDGKLTEVVLHGAGFDVVQNAFIVKYGLPDLVQSPAGKGWKHAKAWRAGRAGRFVWLLDGGEIIVVSMDGRSVMIMYFSTLGRSIQRENF
jgi:hypothetical protein